MGESRDANDPRDQLRALAKEERAEFERDEANDTGGQEHASRADREGRTGERRSSEPATDAVTRSTRERSGADAPRVPRGDPATGTGGNAAGGALLEHAGEQSGE